MNLHEIRVHRLSRYDDTPLLTGAALEALLADTHNQTEDEGTIVHGFLHDMWKENKRVYGLWSCQTGRYIIDVYEYAPIDNIETEATQMRKRGAWDWYVSYDHCVD